MILLQYLHFFCLMMYACMAGYILYKDPKSLLNKTCAILIASFSIWNFVEVFYNIKDITKDTAMLFQNISSIGWIGFSSAVLCFSLAFSKKEKLLKNKWFMVLIVILPIFLIYKQWTNCMIIDPVRQAYGWSYTWTDTIWTYLFYAYYISFTLLAIYFIYRYGKKTEKLREKRKTKIIVASISISLIGGTIFDVVIPKLNIYSIPPLANVFILIFAAALVYTIVKYKFLTITPAVAAENIISAMDELLILLNQEGNILTVNKATLDSLQYEQKELEGKSITMLFQEDSLKKNLLEKITKEEVIKNNDSSFLTKNGKKVPIIYSSSPLKDEEGIVIGTVFIARDITERIRTEEMLHDIIEKNPMSIQILDTEGFTLKVNPAHTLLFGAVPPSDFSIFADLQHKQPEIEKLILLAKSGEIVHLPDLYYNVHDVFSELPDVPFWIHAVLFPLKDKDGKPERFVLMHENITERKQAEEALWESESKFRTLFESANDSLFLMDQDLY